MSFIEEIKTDFKNKNNFTILIYLNLLVFVLVNFCNVIFHLFNLGDFQIISWLSVPSNTTELLRKPWTVITYMFTHLNFLHILLNLLVFYWFGKLFLQFLSQRQLLGVYILGGIAGAIFYIAAFNIFPAFNSAKLNSIALGASASVMAIVITVATLVPNQKVYLLFFGQVKFKYLAIGVLLIDLISIPIDNPGGHLAHLGGALLGYLFVVFYRKGTDITIWISRFLNWVKNIFVPKKEIKITYRKTKRPESDMEYNARKKADQDEIDKILDKVAQSGYGSLSSGEKEKLFNMSNKK